MIEKMSESDSFIETSISIDEWQRPVSMMNPHLPRIRFYESPGTYVVTAILVVLYIVTSGVHFAFDASVAYYVPLISALSILPPFLLCRCFEYMPNLFHQVFCSWVCIIHNLTMLYYESAVNKYRSLTDVEKDPRTAALLIFSLFPFFVVQFALPIYALLSFNYFYLRLHLEALQLRYFWTLLATNFVAMTTAVISMFAFVFYEHLVELYFWGTSIVGSFSIKIVIYACLTCCTHVRIVKLVDHICNYLRSEEDMPRDANGLFVFPPVFDCLKGQKVSPLETEV